MSKKVKCPSCDMAGDPEGDDYSQVTTYHGRPVLQCFWCDSHVLLRRMSAPVVLDLDHKAIRHLRSDLEHDEMVSLLLDNEEDLGVIAQEAPPTAAAAESELLVASTETEPEALPEFERLMAAVETEIVTPAKPAAPKRRRSRKPVAEQSIPVAEFEPAMLAEEPAVDNTPVLLHKDHNTPIGTGAELVSSIPLDARALDHESLIHIAAQVGWTYHTPVRRQPEWMNFKLPEPVELSPFRTKLQGTINMIKYFRINAGTKEQRRAETFARRQRLVEYRRRMFSDKLEALNAMQAIEYKPEAI